MKLHASIYVAYCHVDQSVSEDHRAGLSRRNDVAEPWNVQGLEERSRSNCSHIQYVIKKPRFFNFFCGKLFTGVPLPFFAQFSDQLLSLYVHWESRGGKTTNQQLRSDLKQRAQSSRNYCPQWSAESATCQIQMVYGTNAMCKASLYMYSTCVHAGVTNMWHLQCRSQLNSQTTTYLFRTRYAQQIDS